MLEIREIRKSDNLFLANVIRTVFEEHNAPRTGTVYSDAATDNLFELFQSDNSRFFVAVYNDEIVGGCGIFPTKGLPKYCVELVKFYLLKEGRGKGIGRRLMMKNIELAREIGYKSMYIESLPEFSKAVSIYEKNGFNRLEFPLGNSGHTSCNIWMLKKI